MKILNVIDNLKLGGTQNLAARTWRGLSGCDFEPAVCVLVNSENETTWDDLPESVFRLDCHGDYRKPGAISRWSSQLTRLIDEYQPDLLHSWLWLSDVVTAGAAARTNLPHLVHVVDRRAWQESTRWKHRYRKWMTQRLFRNAGSQFVAVSQAAADYAVEGLNLRPELMDVAWNSINPDPFLQIPDSNAWATDRPLHLGIAARIEREKGHIHLLEAVRSLQSRGVPVRLAITGDGAQRASLEAFVSEHNLSDVVQFVGWVHSVEAFLADIDMFIVPSISSEGLPTTILEAMAAGRLVVASDIGGAAEAITSGTDGIIVPAANPTVLADAIANLSHDRQAAAKMTDRGRRRICDQFSMGVMMDKITSTYASMIRETVSP